MENNITDNQKVEKLISYYKNKGLLIVGLNDSQGVNITSTFFKKGLLEYIASALTSKDLTPKVINAFSLTMNKTEHIDYFLKNNLSLEEIKLSQIYGVISALEKVMTDIKLPKFLGQIGNAYRLIYTPKKGDSEINISTSLKENEEPVLIYSSGVNDLMRAVGANPFGIKSDYKNRDKTPCYYYTLSKVNDSNTLKKVVDAIERNFNNIYGINDKIDIYTLGAYIPKSLQSEEMKIFSDLVIKYNEYLEKLCKNYNITYINTEKVGQKYNTSENNFHISTAGHNALANHILGYMYENKINQSNINDRSYPKTQISNLGAQGVIESTLIDYNSSIQKAKQLFDYEQKREYAIAAERKRENEIFQKVLSKTSK